MTAISANGDVSSTGTAAPSVGVGLHASDLRTAVIFADEFDAGGPALEGRAVTSDYGAYTWHSASADGVAISGGYAGSDGSGEITLFNVDGATQPDSDFVFEIRVRPRAAYPGSVRQSIRLQVGGYAGPDYSEYFLWALDRNNPFTPSSQVIYTELYNSAAEDQDATTSLSDRAQWPAGGADHIIRVDASPTQIRVYHDDVLVHAQTATVGLVLPHRYLAATVQNLDVDYLRLYGTSTVALAPEVTGSATLAIDDTILVVPLHLTVTDGSETATYPLRLTVAAEETASYPLSLTVIDPAALGGLNGTGGWAAAPDGRWQATLILAGVDRSADLVGTVTVKRAVNAATTAEFSISQSAAIAPMGLIGQQVKLAFAQRGAAGEVINAQTLFLGVVHQPTADLPNRLIQCLCTDQLQEVMSKTPREWIDSQVGGRYSVEVSGEPPDTWQYCLDRLASVPKSVALNVLGNPVVIPWRSGAALRVTDDDFLDGVPTLQLPSRDEIRTRITVHVEYRYQALRNRGITSAWSRDARFFINGPDGNPGPITWLTTDMVEGALKSVSGWDLLSLSIEHPPAGSYTIGIGVNAGAYLIPPEVAPDLATGWNAKLRARWMQTRTEKLTLTVVASNLEALLDAPVPEEMGVSVSAPDPDTAWSADRSVRPRFGVEGWEKTGPDMVVAAAVGDAVSAYEPMVDGDSARDKAVNAALTLLDQARIKLWSASRSGRVNVTLPCRPGIFLGPRLEVDSELLHAVGDIVEVEHNLDAQSGDADTTLVAAVGLPGNADSAAPAWTLPAVVYPEANPENVPKPALVATSHTYFVGGYPSSPPFNEETMIGVVTNLDTGAVLLTDAEKAARNWYPVHLTVKTPEIEAIDRDPLDLPAEATYAWDVPTDLVEIPP